jgi:hypothetical protein
VFFHIEKKIQTWKTPQDLGLEGGWKKEWEAFTSELKQAHIRLREEDGVLIWLGNTKRGYYNFKVVYQLLLGVVLNPMV